MEGIMKRFLIFALGVVLCTACNSTTRKEAARQLRETAAQPLANEAAVKIIFPVVFCILPSVLIVIFGPLALQVLQMFRVG